MRSLRSRTLCLTMAGAVSGVIMLVPTPADAAGVTVNMVEGNAKDEKTWVFDPTSINVKVGTVVAWANRGKQPHTASSNDGSFESGTMKGGDTWEHRFDRAGEFPYTCAFHPQMNGVVRVAP